MSAVALIRQAQDAGVALRMVGGKLKAVGKLSVVQSWAPRLREYKSELIEALASNKVDQQIAAAGLFLTPPKLITHADQNWKSLALAYHAHHFKCPVCITAGRGTRYGPRCGVGASLWTVYQNAI